MRRLLNYLMVTVISTLAILTACSSDDSELVTDLTACFELNLSGEINTGDEITFNNCSENASSYLWDFGDGNTTTEKNPTHSYDTVGEYTVTLVVSDGTTEATASTTLEVMNSDQEPGEGEEEEKENYFSFGEERFSLAKGYFLSEGTFENDETGRYHSIILGDEDASINDLDNANSTDYYFYITIITDEDNVGNIVGDFSQYGWNDDAQAGLDYSNIGGEYIPIGDVEDARYDFTATELIITKTDDIYEIKMSANGTKTVGDVETSGAVELYYKGTL